MSSGTRTITIVLIIATILVALGGGAYLLVTRQQGVQTPAAEQAAPPTKQQAAPTVVLVAPTPVAQATVSGPMAENPCAGLTARNLALCEAKNKPAAKPTGIPTITPYPTRGAIALPGDARKTVEDVLRGQGAIAAQALCEKQFSGNQLLLEGCKALVGELAASSVPTPTPTSAPAGAALLHAPNLGVFGQILGFVWGCWTVGWKVGGMVGVLGSIAGELLWILFWAVGAKSIAKKKSEAKGSTILPLVLRVGRWVCVTPIALLDALVPDEWLENPPEFLQSVGALYAVLGFLKGRRGNASGASTPVGGRPPLRRRPK